MVGSKVIYTLNANWNYQGFCYSYKTFISNHKNIENYANYKPVDKKIERKAKGTK